MKKKILREIDFYFITDSKLTKKDIFFDVYGAIDAGCKIVQYREKECETRVLINNAKKIKVLCKNKAIFLINDRIDIAMVVDADGVHLGQEDMPLEFARIVLGNKKIIGLTVHNVKEALEAQKNGADYIAISPVFKTTTKKNAGESCGTVMIKNIKEKVNLPIVAIGGINKDNITQVIKAGADSAVAISTVVCSDDVYSEVKNMIKIIKNSKKINRDY